MKTTNTNEEVEDKLFEGQREDERVVKVFRRHIISMRKGFYLLLGCMVIGSAPFLIWQTNLDLLWVFLGGFGLGLLLFAYHFIIWYYSIFILTDQRLKQITQKGIFGTSVIDLKLSKIHNISYTIPGLSGELFHFGTIVLQTYVGDLVINNVDNPEKVYNALRDAVDEHERGDGHEEDEENIEQE